MSDSQMWHNCPQLAANIPQTITPTKGTNGVVIYSDVIAKVYLSLNWVSGDTEVAATNFDVVMAATGDKFTYQRLKSVWPEIRSIRALSAATGYLGVMAW